MNSCPVPVVLGLGGNLEDREAILAAARRELEEQGVVEIRMASPVIETEPVGPPQPRYLNQVLRGETRLSPLDLLARTKRLERDLGRRPGPRWGPRRIDIDILDYDHRSLELPGLTLPHPEIARREFVLRPWALIDAQHGVPGLGRTVGELLEELRKERG